MDTAWFDKHLETINKMIDGIIEGFANICSDFNGLNLPSLPLSSQDRAFLKQFQEQNVFTRANLRCLINVRNVLNGNKIPPSERPVLRARFNGILQLMTDVAGNTRDRKFLMIDLDRAIANDDLSAIPMLQKRSEELIASLAVILDRVVGGTEDCKTTVKAIRLFTGTISIGEDHWSEINRQVRNKNVFLKSQKGKS